MKNPKISVCMATYNGEAFLLEQINSIIDQLQDGDEFIVVDDGSSDNTLAILANCTDPRLKVFRHESNQGVNCTFERAIRQSKNDYILLADQDDIWVDNRAENMVKLLYSSNALVIASNFKSIDANGNDLATSYYCVESLKSSDSKRHLKNILRIFMGKAAYFGCAMGFKRELLDIVLPIPSYVESYDLWIALAANLARSNLHYEDITLIRRIHGNNVTKFDRPLGPKIVARVIHLRSIVSLVYRLHKVRGCWNSH